jgi:hypothetical protein
MLSNLMKVVSQSLLLACLLAACTFSQVSRDNSGEWVNVRNYGAFGDGSSHPISNSDVSAHPDWSGAYKVGDEWDYVALQEAIYAAFGKPRAEHSSSSPTLNRPLFIPCGKYRVNEEWTWNHIMGGWIRGGGRFCTVIVQTSRDKAIVRTNGFSFGKVEGISFQEAADNQGAAFELDWDGKSTGWTGALQGNTFADNQFSAEGHKAAFGLRIAASSFMGSENLFLDNHFQWFTSACFFSSAFNTLQNTIIGGNFGNCSHDGIYVRAGAIQVYSVGFQNGVWDQTGWDVEIINSADDISSIENSRTESAHFVRAGNLHRLRLLGNHQSIGCARWQSQHNYSVNSLVTGIVGSKNNDGKLYRAASNCSSGLAEPVWPGSGKTTDGTCTWGYVDIIGASGGNLRLYDNQFMFGTVEVYGATHASLLIGNTFSRRDWLQGSPYGNAENLVMQFGNSVYLSGGFNEGGSTTAWGTPVLGAHQAMSQLNLGDSVLLWSDGSGGVLHPEAGLEKAAAGILNSIGGFSAGMDMVTPGSAVIIDCSKGNTHQLTLRQDASARVTGCYRGQEIVTIICQPDDGDPYNFVFPTSFHGVSQVSRRRHTCTVQSFRWSGDAAYATSSGAVNER